MRFDSATVNSTAEFWIILKYERVIGPSPSWNFFFISYFFLFIVNPHNGALTNLFDFFADGRDSRLVRIHERAVTPVLRRRAFSGAQQGAGVEKVSAMTSLGTRAHPAPQGSTCIINYQFRTIAFHLLSESMYALKIAFDSQLSV